ncbi:MAG: hypothetical protein FJ280_32180, partial [Planctomycetes bacterium]|nr:hypothetical protein [Planctomycetota bacterium]
MAHNVDLSWPASSGRRSFDVYFGLAEEAIAGAKRSCLHHKSAQTEARFDPGPLAPNTTYYWRVDTIEPNGVVHAGPVWSFTTTYGKYEGKLEGCCKWLLHLGQNPTDGFLAGINPLHIEWYVAPRPQTGVKPCPGLPCDTLRNFTDATQPILVWTPQCSGTGVFGDNPSDGETQQIYLVYIGSPSERHAQLRTKHIRSLHAWNNGRLLFQHQGTGYPTVEHVFDFVLFEGANMPVLDSVGNAEMKEHLTAWITDTQGSEYADLTYSLAPPPEARGTRVRRILPDSQGSVDKIDVSLDVRMDPNDKPSRLKIVEYIPAGTSVADAGGGTVLTNAIQWSLSAADVVPTHIRYTLGKASDIAERTAFCGYFYDGKALADVGGDSVVFAATLESPVEMAGRISTVVLPAEQLKTDRYTKGQNVDVGRLADNLPLYPVERRWDWTHPFTLSTLPNLLYDVAGSSALVAHVRTVQENLVDDQEQFRVLPNLVLPIFLSYYDAPRLRLTLTADAQPGDERLRVARHLPYGATGNP